MTGEFILRGEPTESAVFELIQQHRAFDAPRMQKNYDYYLGRVRVEKGNVASGRPDNQAYSNLAKYITDTATGYFAGVPPTYCFDSGAEEFRHVMDLNDETSLNYEIAENMSVAGVGYDLVWIDENGNIRITSIDPRTAFVVRADTVEQEPMAGIRYWQNGDEWAGEMYLRGEVVYFKFKESLKFTARTALPFSGIAMTEYENNRFHAGDFEGVIKNIDQYNLTLSNTTDDLQSIANAFLAIVGMTGTDEEDIARMNRDRVVLLSENGQMEFITKDLNSEAVEHHLKILKQDIMQVAGVPDLSDEFFSGNASGVALEYKMWGLNQLFAKKCAGMEKGLFSRLKLISEALRIMGYTVGDAVNIASVKFTRNMPRDMSTSVDNAVKLNGIVSKRTVFEQLAPITGVQAEDEIERSIIANG